MVSSGLRWHHTKVSLYVRVSDPCRDTELTAEYLCPKCSGSQNNSAVDAGSENEGGSSSALSMPSLSRSDYPHLWRLLESLMEHRASWPFRQPVDATKHPDYYRIVKHPMGMSIVPLPPLNWGGWESLSMCL